jgi:hypothetical protein
MRCTRRCAACSVLCFTRAPQAKEAEVVRDVLWSSQGLEGQLTVLQGGAATDSEQAYQLRPGAALPAPELALVLCHTELGWLFK